MSRARSIWLVARRELLERGRSRGFIFSVLFTTTIIIGSFVVPVLIFGDEGPTRVGVVEPAPDRLDSAITTTAAPGTKVGTAKAQVSALALGGALLPLAGDIVVAPPGAVTPASQTGCIGAATPQLTLLLVLQAAPKDCICPYTWRYPIVGQIPYKGFFDFAAARREADRLAARGYDVYLRPSAAFSTLGWFNDPLLSTALTHDSVELAATVFHEIAHNTLYVRSATPFNESFAQFVGYRSAESFFTERSDTANARQASDRLNDEMVLGEFYATLITRLDSLYATEPDSAALEAGRTEAAVWARAELLGPVGAKLRSYRLGNLPERPINNARLIGATLYRTRLDLFDRWFERHGRDVRESVSGLKELMQGADGDTAFVRLERAVPP